MKRLSRIRCWSRILATTAIVPPAQAQWTVFDPQNYAQNLLEAARALQQINNQIQALQNQAVMLQNMATNLNPSRTFRN